MYEKSAHTKGFKKRCWPISLWLEHLKSVLYGHSFWDCFRTLANTFGIRLLLLINNISVIHYCIQLLARANIEHGIMSSSKLNRSLVALQSNHYAVLYCTVQHCFSPGPPIYTLSTVLYCTVLCTLCIGQEVLGSHTLGHVRHFTTMNHCTTLK